MITYVDNFPLMRVFTLTTLPIVLMLRRLERTAGWQGRD